MNNERNPKGYRLVKNTVKIVKLILLLGLWVLGSVFWLYWKNFKHLPLSQTPADWGVFGDFIGGTANPILSFLTIILLAFTLVLQSSQLSISSRELRLSREELAFTRKELERSAAAQELSERALRAQAEAAEVTAKLAAINALMEHYGKEIKHLKSLNPSEGSGTYDLMLRYIDRQLALEELLEQYYVDLTSIDEKQIDIHPI
jgi:hypothetical protein